MGEILDELLRLISRYIIDRVGFARRVLLFPLLRNVLILLVNNNRSFRRFSCGRPNNTALLFDGFQHKDDLLTMKR